MSETETEQTAESSKKKTSKKKAAGKKANRIEKKTITKEFWNPLTDKELSAVGKEAGQLKAQINTRETALKNYNKERKAEIAELELEFSDLCSVLVAGKRKEEIECEMVKDFAKKTVRYMKGRKILEEREMTTEELQTSFNVSDKPVEPKPEDKEDGPIFAGAEDDGTDKDVSDVIAQETNKRTKTSAVDSVTT